jgi:hypothetical protein
MYKAQALQPRLLSWCAFGAGYPGGRLGIWGSGSPKGGRDDSLGWSEAEPQVC